jgi:hypothetical protein
MPSATRRLPASDLVMREGQFNEECAAVAEGAFGPDSVVARVDVKELDLRYGTSWERISPEYRGDHHGDKSYPE